MVHNLKNITQVQPGYPSPPKVSRSLDIDHCHNLKSEAVTFPFLKMNWRKTLHCLCG